MNPQSLIANAQSQAEQNLAQNQTALGSQPATGSTTDQALQALQQSDQQQASTPAPQQTGNQPSLLERLIPTVGAVGGGILGDLLGPVGGVAGAAGGSALGKALEDKLTGQAGGNGVLGAAAGGALGQGVGEGVGALLGKTGSLATNIGDKMAATQADKAAQVATDAGTQADNQAAVDTATNYKNNYGSLSDRLQRDLKLGTNGKFVDSMGGDGSNPQDMQAVSQGGQELNSVYNDALEKAPDVAMGDFGNQIYKTMQENGTTDLSTTPLGKALQDFGLGPNETVPESMPATQVRQLQQSVGTQIGNTQKIINNAEIQGQANTEAEGQLQTLNNVYKSLGTKLKTPEVNQAVAQTNVDDTARAALQEKYGEAHGNYIADTINNAQGADDLLKPMQSYTQMGKASNMALNDIENAPGTARNLARTKTDIASPAQSNSPFSTENAVNIGSVGEALIGHHPAALAIPLALKAAENPAVVQAVGGGLSKLGGSAIPGIIGAAGGELPQDVAQPGNQSNNIQDTMNPQSSILNTLITADLDNVLNGGLTQLPQAVQMQQKANAATAAEQNLAQNFNLAGGAQGPLGGILSRLGAGLTGGEAGRYQGQAQADQQAIAQALGVPAQEVSTPSINQNQSSAQASLGNIQSLIQALLQGGAVPQTGGIVAGAQQ